MLYVIEEWLRLAFFHFGKTPGNFMYYDVPGKVNKAELAGDHGEIDPMTHY